MSRKSPRARRPPLLAGGRLGRLASGAGRGDRARDISGRRADDFPQRLADGWISTVTRCPSLLCARPYTDPHLQVCSGRVFVCSGGVADGAKSEVAQRE